MKDRCIVLDHGLQVEFARALARSGVFSEVMYCAVEASPYPNSKVSGIGTGIPEIKRIYNYEQYRCDEDIVWAFPDVYFGDMQEQLKKVGRKVYGAGKAERIELDKIAFLELIEKLGLPVIPYELVDGFDKLQEALKGKRDVYLKRPYYRGDFETMHVESWEHIKGWVYERMHALGERRAQDAKIIIQQRMDAITEWGYDGYCLNGKFTAGMVGPEIKDKGYIGIFVEEMPEPLKKINDAMSPVLKRLGYQGPLSTEVRFTADGKAYYIDPTHREPSPPGELKQEMFNVGEIVNDLANGRLPKVKAKAKHGVQIILESGAYNDGEELYVDIPEEVERFVKLKNLMKKGKKSYCIAITDEKGRNINGPVFGSVVAYDDDLKKAQQRAIRIAKLVKAADCHFKEDVFEEADAAIEAGRKVGIEV